MVNDIALSMFNNHQSAMYDDEPVLSFFENTIPFSQSNPEDLAEIRAWGSSRAVPAGTAPVLPSFDGGAGRRIVLV